CFLLSLSSFLSFSLSLSFFLFLFFYRPAKMAAPLQLVCFFVALLSTLFLGAATWSDCWIVNADDSLEVSHKCQGLWRKCVTNVQDGIKTCDQYDSILAEHPMKIVVTRALLITSDLLSGCALVLLVSGLDCIKGFLDEPRMKRKMHSAAGLALGTGGVLGLVGSLWYAVNAYMEKAAHVPHNVFLDAHQDFGWSCWLGLIGSAGNLAACILLSCCLHYDSQRVLRSSFTLSHASPLGTF
uniref:Claudin n=1 Tax=Pseudonaja textilis TaxID=8673 RepID=A0A670ZMR7_PSETE